MLAGTETVNKVLKSVGVAELPAGLVTTIPEHNPKPELGNQTAGENPVTATKHYYHEQVKKRRHDKNILRQRQNTRNQRRHM